MRAAAGTVELRSLAPKKFLEFRCSVRRMAPAPRPAAQRRSAVERPASKYALLHVNHVARLHEIALLCSEGRFTAIRTDALDVDSPIAAARCEPSGAGDRLQHRHTGFEPIFVGLL